MSYLDRVNEPGPKRLLTLDGGGSRGAQHVGRQYAAAHLDPAHLDSFPTR